MRRATKAAEAAAIKPHTLIIDNGGSSIKAGFAGASPGLDDCQIIPNCIARDHERRLYVGRQLEKCKDFYHIAVRRPVEKGMVVNWELERAIWHQTFLSEKDAVLKKCDPHETNLILTEAPNVFPALQTNCDQMVFEEFEFASYYRTTSAPLNAYNDVQSIFGDEPQTGARAVPTAADCLLVIDSGFSHTTVTPLLNGCTVQDAVRRLDVGGKHLTNYLSELLAIHEISLKDDPWIANEVKETACFVTDDFRRDVERTWRGHCMDPSIVVDCQLPDYQEYFKVIVRPYEAKDAMFKAKHNIATLGSERFQVPELLFTPGDIGMVEGGLAELTMQSIGLLPEGLRAGLLANILLVGGNARIPGFVDRLQKEIRQLAPIACLVRVVAPSDPVKSTWLGGARMATSTAELRKHLVTRQQYLEHGHNWLSRRFAGLE